LEGQEIESELDDNTEKINSILPELLILPA